MSTTSEPIVNPYLIGNYAPVTKEVTAFALPLGQVEASAAMEDAIEERFPEVVLKVVADFLVD